jgi:Flp pilus assembly protein TadB
VIVHRRRPLHPASLIACSLLVALFGAIVAAGGGLEHWAVAAVIWSGTLAVLVRRFRARGRRDVPPPWAV